jgi:hypothetical protein
MGHVLITATAAEGQGYGATQDAVDVFGTLQKHHVPRRTLCAVEMACRGVRAFFLGVTTQGNVAMPESFNLSSTEDKAVAIPLMTGWVHWQCPALPTAGYALTRA